MLTGMVSLQMWDGGMVGWQDGGIARWQDGWMAGWQHGENDGGMVESHGLMRGESNRSPMRGEQPAC
jgi:hypothetical protein